LSITAKMYNATTLPVQPGTPKWVASPYLQRRPSPLWPHWF